MRLGKNMVTVGVQIIVLFLSSADTKVMENLAQELHHFCVLAEKMKSV